MLAFKVGDLIAIDFCGLGTPHNIVNNEFLFVIQVIEYDSFHKTIARITCLKSDLSLTKFNLFRDDKISIISFFDFHMGA